MKTKEKRSRKVTISLPEELVVYTDRRADQKGTNRSQVISQALAHLMAFEEEQLAAEGYAFYAAEAEGFAASSGQAVAEAWGRDTEEAQP